MACETTNHPEIVAANEEAPEYLTEQIITYLGNKRSLLTFIGDAIQIAQAELGREKLSMFDVFSGTGIVSRYFKRFANRLYVNDLEAYSQCVNSCYLTNRSDVDMEALQWTLADLKTKIKSNLHGGLITELYAPKDDNDIQAGERVFYTRRNANFIDTACQEITLLPENIRRFFLAPLIYGASVHANTSGVFKGFYKNRNGMGQFGGHAQNALSRIRGDIELMLPIFSRFECDCEIYRKDALTAALEMPEDVDFAYLDPPYNQHPYGSNYFMLNLILDYRMPERVSRVSGIPNNWNRSAYNQRHKAQETLFTLVENVKAKYILISYNSDGFVKYDDFVEHLSKLGELTTMSMDYNTFRGCRNLSERDIHVKEYLFMLKRE
ncbi:MAG: DNA adenine methylase [Victivallales bacterium]|nr:DNA adenine methylase [Victivallales bacterium]